MEATTSTTTQLEALDELRTLGHADGDVIVPAARVVDLLLDTLNATAEPAVRVELCRHLTRFSRRSLVTGAELRTSVHEVDAAVATEAAFAHLVIA